MRFEEAYEGWNEGRLTQEEAARLLGVCERSFRRYAARFEAEGLDGLIDRRLEPVSHRAAPVDEVMAQINVSAAALKCGVRDRWIGWDFRSQYGRLKRIADHSRFLILPEWRRPNIGSRVLSLTERRVGADWQARFGHPLLRRETFVDPWTPVLTFPRFRCRTSNRLP